MSPIFFPGTKTPPNFQSWNIQEVFPKFPVNYFEEFETCLWIMFIIIKYMMTIS